MGEVRFKAYVQDQPMLLPPSLDELIGEQDLVRVVNNVLEGLDWKLLITKVRVDSGGAPAHHPVMMAKVLVYAYTQGIYSTRKISKALEENVKFMWLSGMQRVSHMGVSRFRTDYLKDVLEPVFAQVIEALLYSGHVRSQDYFLDGTKLEANANKHKVLYNKNNQRFSEAVRRRARQIFAEVEAINRAEDGKYGGAEVDLPERGDPDKPLDSSAIAAAAEKINEELRESPPAAKKTARKLATYVRKLEKEAAQLVKYEAQAEVLGTRSTASKTDPDAVLMPMKQSKDFKPGYNLQAGTQDGYVTGYSLSNNCNDAATLAEHLGKRRELGLPQPGRLVADAIYGQEHNYDLLERAGIESLMKYPDWRREHTRRARDAYHKSRFTYDAAADQFSCPEGKVLKAAQCKEGQRLSGYAPRVTEYHCHECQGCPARELCLRQGGSYRTLSVSHKLEAYKAQTRAALESAEGATTYAQRSHACETVFAQLKAHDRFGRFRMRGLAKNTLDLAIYFTAYNLRKLANRMLANNGSHAQTLAPA